MEGHYRAQRINHRRAVPAQASTCLWLMRPGVRSTHSSSAHLFPFKGATGNPREVTCVASVVKWALEAGKDGKGYVFEALSPEFDLEEIP